jgi:hypothetical protein
MKMLCFHVWAGYDNPHLGAKIHTQVWIFLPKLTDLSFHEISTPKELGSYIRAKKTQLAKISALSGNNLEVTELVPHKGGTRLISFRKKK